MGLSVASIGSTSAKPIHLSSVKALWESYKSGMDLGARDQLLAYYGYLSKSAVKKIWGRVSTFCTYDDLKAWADFGLFNAMEAFTLAKGVPFPKYAPKRIRGTIFDCIREQDQMSRGLRKEGKMRIVSLNGDIASWCSTSMQNPAELAEQHERREILLAALERLPRQRQAIFVACELDGLTQADAAKRLGITQSYICQNQEGTWNWFKRIISGAESEEDRYNLIKSDTVLKEKVLRRLHNEIECRAKIEGKSFSKWLNDHGFRADAFFLPRLFVNFKHYAVALGLTVSELLPIGPFKPTLTPEELFF